MNLYVYKKFGVFPGVYTTDKKLISKLNEMKEKFELWYTVCKMNGVLLGKAFLLKKPGRLCDLKELIRGIKKTLRAHRAR